MSNGHSLLIIVFTPIICACILPVLGKVSAAFRNYLALAAVLVSFVYSASLLPLVYKGELATFTVAMPLGFDFTLRADSLAVFMACVSSFISVIIVLYSFDYISHYRNQNEYYSFVVLFLGSMMGLVFSGNLVFLYLFWEITAITSWRLIGFSREKEHALRADKALLMTVSGALLMLLGFIRLYLEAGSFDLAAIRLALQSQSISGLTVGLILAGIFSKSATLPLHTWLPDAGIAPAPVTALLHAAVLVKIGVYAFARIFIVTIPLDLPWKTFVLVLCGISALVSAGAAYRETDLKRIIAYSTISQIAFIFLGFACGVQIGVAGALLYILMHGLAKAGLFLCAGIVEHNAKTKDITRLGGLINVMPVTALAFLFCAFSVMGVPPLGGFFAKYMVFAGAMEGSSFWIVSVFLLGAILTILYLYRAFSAVFLGELKISASREGSPVMVFCVALFAALSLAGGILVNYPGVLARYTAQQMLSWAR
ncbi:MAG: NADH-quinone oxidoreductase subunit L [Candidatus Omnitrophota bacterium]|nr:NADH-quinone oxidoreductase subunit L [Candidatus Omnitrophota bacterium]